MMSYFDFLSLTIAILAVLMLITSVDDIVIDSIYWLNKLYKTFIAQNNISPSLTVKQLHTPEEQAIAIMVPTWQEQDVIAKMIQQLADNLDYQTYHLFIGTYPNDIETIAEIERIKQHYPQVHRIEVPHDGPTCKADCLNAIYQNILHYETHHQHVFQGYLLHDSEDVVHPLELKLFNALLPHYDLMQIPVRVIEQQITSLISGTYIDEFAEWHTKDIVVRALLTGIVPSAGVGTCFSRTAMSVASEQGINPPFNVNSMTEDYDVSLRIGLHGLPTTFTLLNVPYSNCTLMSDNHTPQNQTKMRPLAVLEYFPDTLKTAYRQKARWIMGIGLQGWQNFGWKGSWLCRYFLYRDRKSLITPFINMASYIIALQLIIITLITPEQHHYATQNTFSWTQTTYLILSLVLLLRLIQRAYFVAVLYDWRQAAMSLPRTMINNVINFFAVCRAWRLFLSHLKHHHPIVWDKTTHRYPDLLKTTKNNALLSLIKQQGMLSQENIDFIPVTIQQHDDQLVDYLYHQTHIDQNKLCETIAYETGLPIAYFQYADLQQLKKTLPKEAFQHPQAIPFKLKDNGYLCLAATVQLPLTTLDYFRQTTHYPVEPYIAPLNQINQMKHALS